MATLAEQALRLNARRPRKAIGFALLTDTARLPDPLPLLPLLPKGALVILRHYDAPSRADLARRLARTCRARRLRFSIAAELDLAVALGCGLHLPEGLAHTASARTRLWHRRTKQTLTAAAHSRAALARAAILGADLAFLGPVFATASHPGAPGMGAWRFRQLVRGARVPVLALGGVSKTSVRKLRGSGAEGVATVGGLSAR